MSLSPRARAVKITKADPPDECQLAGGFYTYKDCLKGLGVGNTDESAQMECIKWKADSLGGNWATLDATIGDGYYRGRVYTCPISGQVLPSSP